MISLKSMKAKNIVSVRLDEDSYNDLVEQANDDSVTITEKCREHIENGISGSFDEQEPKIEYRDKEVIKEVPKIEYRDKIIKVPEIQTQYVDRPVEKIVEKRVGITPNYLPRYQCSEGCIHNNKNYSDKVKSKCSDCDQFTPSNECLFCGSNDLNPIDKDELKDKGIPLPIPTTHHINNLECPSRQCSYQASNHSLRYE